MDTVDTITSKGIQYEVADSHARMTMLPRSELPKAVSYFENDAGYIDRNVKELTNFYGKQDTYTRDDVDGKISEVDGKIDREIADVSGRIDGGFKRLFVDALPEQDIDANAMYVVPRGDAGQEPGDLYDEYLWTEHGWERVGNTRVDLSGYCTTQDAARIESALAEEAESRKEADKSLSDTAETALNRLSSETAARQDADDGLGKRIDAARTALQGEIDAIDAKIPAQAGADNKLADKDFVNSSIATNTAYFIGTFGSLDALKEYGGDKTNNDYAFVKTTDEAGNTLYNRYKWNEESGGWLFEYSLNNSGFTAEQWKAVNSGATAEKIARIKDGNGTDSGLLRLSDAVDGTQGTEDATAATPGAVKRAYDKASSAGSNAADALERIDSEVAARKQADDAMDALIQQLRTTKQDKIPVVDTKDELELEDGEIGIAKEDGLFYQDGDELLIVATKENEPVITTDNSPKRLKCTVSRDGTDIIYTVDIWPAFKTMENYEKILVTFYTPCTNGILGISMPIIRSFSATIVTMSALSTGNITYDGSELSDGVAEIRFRGKGVGNPGQVQHITYIRI